MPQPEDSGGPPHPRHLHGCFVLASGTLRPWPSASMHFEAVPTFRARGCPYGLQDSLCTLHLSCSATPSASATGATLDTGGWLALARPGLAPSKIRQACLGAVTSALTARSAFARRRRTRCEMRLRGSGDFAQYPEAMRIGRTNYDPSTIPFRNIRGLSKGLEHLSFNLTDRAFNTPYCSINSFRYGICSQDSLMTFDGDRNWKVLISAAAVNGCVDRKMISDA
jgi:hypothetical protein